MDIITDSVTRLEEIIHHSGCEETGVHLDVDPTAKTCEYERGACMVASFGGRSAEFVTDDPIRAMTKISFMFGASLETPRVRSAACAIINVATGFFCLSRVLHACPKASHAPCLRELTEKLERHRVFCIGKIPVLERAQGLEVTTNIDKADIILVNNEGIIAPETGDLVAAWGKRKQIIFLGPSTAGVSRIQQQEHWCPYGKQTPDFIPAPSQ
ncbi:hypothetical protein [Methanoregula sp.]|jgi:hypothetical protein|uniref:hypothetical protein n=1 Tax=Methanoregula sp. TaxID=2052170 RepID=UPI0025D3F5E8|nr:hypothetical protein [Methanoregula sp.]